MKTNTTCPRCGAQDVLPIVYGYPGPELTEASMAGKVALGGCVLGSNPPDRLCQSCRHRWLELERLLNAPPDEPITVDKGHGFPTYTPAKTKKKPKPT